MVESILCIVQYSILSMRYLYVRHLYVTQYIVSTSVERIECNSDQLFSAAIVTSLVFIQAIPLLRSLTFRCHWIKIILRCRDQAQTTHPNSIAWTQWRPSSHSLAFLSCCSLRERDPLRLWPGERKGHVTEGASEVSSFRRPTPTQPNPHQALGLPSSTTGSSVHKKNQCSLPTAPNRERSPSKGFPAAVSPRTPWAAAHTHTQAWVLFFYFFSIPSCYFFPSPPPPFFRSFNVTF